jgi:hypothetical protein
MAKMIQYSSHKRSDFCIHAASNFSGVLCLKDPILKHLDLYFRQRMQTCIICGMIIYADYKVSDCGNNVMYYNSDD